MIRPFASDSPTSSAKPSPQALSTKQTSDLRAYSPPQQKTRGAPATSLLLGETPSRMSPVTFTSSSSSSSSGSPYRGRSPVRTPPPPSLAPNPVPTGSPRALSPSPMRSSPSSSRSLSPPTLYRSPDVEEDQPPFIETPVVARTTRRSSPSLAPFPSYPPSRFSLPMTTASQAKAAATAAVNRPPPPPSKAAAAAGKSKQSVVTETVSKIIVSTYRHHRWHC